MGSEAGVTMATPPCSALTPLVTYWRLPFCAGTTRAPGERGGPQCAFHPCRWRCLSRSES
eukprot:105545-Pyramimonas_sp.AAC.1